MKICGRGVMANTPCTGVLGIKAQNTKSCTVRIRADHTIYLRM